MWLTETQTAAAAIPASARRRFSLAIRLWAPSVAWKAAQAASSEIVQLQMLKVWLYQAFLFFSHSGTCWITPKSATSSGGSSITAGIKKTTVVWYDWFLGVRTTKSCAIAAADPRMMNVAQLWVPARRCVRRGSEAAAAA